MPCVRKLFSCAENVRDAAERRDRLRRRCRFGFGGRPAERRRTETAAGQDQLTRAWKDISRIARETGPRRRIWKTECRSSRKASCGTKRQCAAERCDVFNRQQRRSGNQSRRRTQQGRDDYEPANARCSKGNRSGVARRFHARTQSYRSRQRTNRRHHELHKHEQPERNDRGRSACKKGGRARVARGSCGENVAGAWFARGFRLSPANRPATISRPTWI